MAPLMDEEVLLTAQIGIPIDIDKTNGAGHLAEQADSAAPQSPRTWKKLEVLRQAIREVCCLLVLYLPALL